MTGTSQKGTILYYALIFLARLFSKLAKIFARLAGQSELGDIQLNAVISSTSYNMVEAPDEPYYAEQYWSVLLPYIEKMQAEITVLDLGCSQGRLTLRLGKQFPDGKIIGCDISNNAIRIAEEYAASDSVKNIDFRVQKISECIDAFDTNTVDIVLMTEVTFFYPDWDQDMPRIMNVLKPGGILIVSFRSQYFDALCLARMQEWDKVDSVIKDRQGAIFGGSTIFTWNTSQEISSLLTDDYGFELLDLSGIGVCSGIPGDPHDAICRPSQLLEREQAELMKLEMELGKSVPDAGRYILAVARKPSNSF
jgi:2-polyprenyl-3-methyl-5-hydroxy-6-metoxy-1,4-benzoquinol methylase